MAHIKILYQGTTLLVPDWLEPLWPYELPLDKWPSFCGAGEGFGDKIVPEFIRTTCVSPACFIHDVDWAVSPDTFKEFLSSNWRFFKNCASLIYNSSGLTYIQKFLSATSAIVLWFGAVTTVGALCFDPLGDSFKDPFDNPVVKEKLHKLSLANIEYERRREMA